jgi:hypothetical protein
MTNCVKCGERLWGIGIIVENALHINEWIDILSTFVAALNVCAIIVAAAVEDCRCILDSWKCDDSGTCEI